MFARRSCFAAAVAKGEFVGARATGVRAPGQNEKVAIGDSLHLGCDAKAFAATLATNGLMETLCSSTRRSDQLVPRAM